jgi:hypothetical protein
MVMGLAMAAAGLATTWTSAAVPNEDAEILRLREAAWRAWFSADEAALRRILPTDFIGIGMKAGPLATLGKAIEDSRAFHATGARLAKLEFPETQFQRYGDVVILYGRYRIAVEAAGKQETTQGRLTEMFLKRNGVWVHTGWHLDTVAHE